MSSLIELEWAWGRSHFAIYLGELEVGTDTKIINNHDHFVGPPLLDPLPAEGWSGASGMVERRARNLT